MAKALKLNYLPYAIMTGLLIFVASFIFNAWCEANINTLPVDEIVASGHKYLIFGSQDTNGIELYDLKQKKFIPFLIPAKKDIIYRDPVVGTSGKGYCIRLTGIFDTASNTVDLISFDLNFLNHQPARSLQIKKYAAFALSPDEKKIALVYATSLDSPYLIGIYNIAKGKIENTFSVDSRFETPLGIVWKSDNKTVVIWSALMSSPPAVEIDAKTGQSQNIDNFPLDYKGKYMLAMDGKKETIYFQDLSSGEKHIIVKKNATGHSFSISRDGKYVVLGWLRGLGAETLTVMEIKSKRRFQLKTTEGTVLGLVLW